MPDGPKIWETVYETVYAPIKKRPLPSLSFFAVWLGAGLWLRYKWGFPEKPETAFVAAFTLAFVIPGVGLLLCLHRLLVARDPPSSLKDLGALEKIKSSFVGREDDAANLMDLILHSHQIWLNGDSGVGKSVLLQKAILPELANRKLEAVYLNFWRGDWEEAPALAILEKLGKQGKKKVLEALENALHSFHGVIILDQFDEFQIEHRDKFISATSQVISRADLESRNGFFRILNAAIREQRIRCIFITRRDVEWGKRPVLLENADEFILRRLPGHVIEAEISRIVSSEVVQDPENGWLELRAQLCDDLADDGILPVQMRFAILGLQELRDNLTRAAYLRQGGLHGLVSGYVEREVRRVSGDKALSREVLLLLDRLVTPDGQSTVSIAEAELLHELPEPRASRIQQALSDLQRSDIIRRVLSPDGAVLWRLDHDYLVRPVRRIARRQLPEQWEIKEAYDRFVAAPWWNKPGKLAFPVPLFRYLRARLFRGLSFGSAASWVLFSISAWLFLMGAAAYLGWNDIETVADERHGRELFSVFSEFGENGGYSEEEAKALRELTSSSLSVREAFLQTGLQSASNSARISSHSHELALALSHFSVEDLQAVFRHSVSPVFDHPRVSGEVLSASASLINRWTLSSLLSMAEADALAGKLVERMSAQNTDSSTLSALASGLGALSSRVSPDKADALAGKLVERMSAQNTDPYTDFFRVPELASGLGALGSRVSPDKANTLAGKLVERMSAPNTDSSTLRALATELGALGSRVRQDKVDAAASMLVERMSALNTDSYTLRDLATGLDALGSRVSPDKADTAASMLVNHIANGRNSDRVRSFGTALAAFTQSSLTSQDLARIWRAFEIPSAPCALILRLDDRTAKQAQLLHQLTNPVCKEGDWKKMALALAQLTGQSFASGDMQKPSEIKVDFVKLCNYIASQRSTNWHWNLPWPEVVGLSILLAAVIIFMFGVMKLPARSISTTTGGMKT